jgi:hypothetical protein
MYYTIVYSHTNTHTHKHSYINIIFYVYLTAVRASPEYPCGSTCTRNTVSRLSLSVSPSPPPLPRPWLCRLPRRPLPPRHSLARTRAVASASCGGEILKSQCPCIFLIFFKKGHYELDFQIFCLWILRGPGAGVSSGRFLDSMAARSRFPPKNKRSRLPSWLATSRVAQIERRCACAGAHTRTHTASLLWV